MPDMIIMERRQYLAIEKLLFREADEDNIVKLSVNEIAEALDECETDVVYHITDADFKKLKKQFTVRLDEL